jgi:hypothetical protein
MVPGLTRGSVTQSLHEGRQPSAIRTFQGLPTALLAAGPRFPILRCPDCPLVVAAPLGHGLVQPPGAPHMPSIRTLSTLPTILLIASAAHASVVDFVNNPTGNSTDMIAWAASIGVTSIDTSVDFEAHPEGELISTFYPGVMLHGENVTLIQGPGSRSGAEARPSSEGEGLLGRLQGYTSNGSDQPGWSLTVTFETPVFAAGFMTADVFDAWGDNGLTIEAFDGDDASGSLLGSAPSAQYNFELNHKYFMGLGDDEGRIKSIRISTPQFLYGDSQYVDAVIFTGKVTTTPCPGDLDGDGSVGGADLAIMLGGWGSSGLTDLDGSGITDGGDLAILLGAWGACA